MPMERMPCLPCPHVEVFILALSSQSDDDLKPDGVRALRRSLADKVLDLARFIDTRAAERALPELREAYYHARSVEASELKGWKIQRAGRRWIAIHADIGLTVQAESMGELIPTILETLHAVIRDLFATLGDLRSANERKAQPVETAEKNKSE
jgi:hypothetical protein